MKPNPLTKRTINKILKDYPDWICDKSCSKLITTITFKQHSTALVFLMRVTVQAEVLNHHPDILFTYRKLKITTTTHEIDALSKLDIELVKRIDRIRSMVGE